MREGTVRKAEGRACAAGVTLDGFYAWRGLRRPDGASAARMGLLATSRYHAGRYRGAIKPSPWNRAVLSVTGYARRGGLAVVCVWSCLLTPR